MEEETEILESELIEGFQIKDGDDAVIVDDDAVIVDDDIESEKEIISEIDTGEFGDQDPELEAYMFGEEEL